MLKIKYKIRFMFSKKKIWGSNKSEINLNEENSYKILYLDDIFNSLRSHEVKIVKKSLLIRKLVLHSIE